MFSNDNHKHGESIYYISPEQLLIILSEFDYDVNFKRTRSWLKINDIDDYQIERKNPVNN